MYKKVQSKTYCIGRQTDQHVLFLHVLFSQNTKHHGYIETNQITHLSTFIPTLVTDQIG